ncbi:MAG: hypothetical protein CK424_05705 [Legionella sp.]|nr:MAG: hypothetical protein CK424_05705 [Legionella sp.]
MQNRDSEYKKTRSPKKYWMEGVYYMNGWSPFLNHLKEYYKSHDKFRSLVDDDNGEGLSLKNYYVNLALVTEAHHESVVSHVQESSLKREERYQDMLLSGRTLGVNELFDNLDSRLDSAGWISITGRAGAGKTTLLQYIAYRWGGVREGLWHNRFDFVFRVQLNLLKNDKYKHHSYEQILSKLIYESFAKTEHYTDVLSEEVIYRSIVEKKFRNRTLLLLDGFDEIQGLYNDEHKHVKDFIDRVMGQFPNGVMATRPDALPKAWQLEQPSRFKKQYENVGFTVDDVYQYVDKYFKEDERAHKESLLAALDANPEMMSLAQIPINTHILCLTWKSREESVSDSQDSAHFTMTQLYQRLLIWLLKRYCKKFKSVTEKNPERLLAICETELSTLSTIAYTAFVDKKIQFLEGEFVKQHVKSSTFMEVLSKEFGILRAFNEREDGYADYFYFVHLTYQEFFAALYMAKQLSVKPKDNREEEIERRKNIQSIVKIIVANRDNPQYEVTWIFLSGLLSMSDYQIGADYFWDAIIEFPEEDVEAVTFHPHSNILHSKQRICREAFLTLMHAPSLVIPQRLSILKTHFQHLHLWQGVQQTEALVQTWNYYEYHSIAARVYHNTQKQYQTDTVVLGFQTENSFSLLEFLMDIPYVKQVLEKYKSSSSASIKLGSSQLCIRDLYTIQNLRNPLKNPEMCANVDSSESLGQFGVKDTDIIQNLRNRLQYSNVKGLCTAAEALGKLGVRDPNVIQDLRDLLKTPVIYVRGAAANALGQLGVKDPDLIQDLRDFLKSLDDEARYYALSFPIVYARYLTIRALKNVQGLTIAICIERLKHETHFEVIGEIYVSLLRIKPYDYLPYLVNHAHPDLPYLFVAASYFQGVMIVQKKRQLYLGDTLLDVDAQVIQSILAAKAHFIERMGGYSESLNTMNLAINAPKITSVFSEDFLNSNLPEDLSYDMAQRVRHIDESVRVLSYRVEGLGQEVGLLRAEFNRIQKNMESEWQRVQDILPSDDVAYIKKFKQQLVQMYIVATVATSGDVQMCLAGTAGTVVTVLDVIAGLVPWGGGAVQLLSYLTQAIGEKVKQNRMERVLRLGSTPEDVAILATHLGCRLLHCLEIEHYARDGRINRLFNSLGNIVGGYAENGFYGALFEAFTESGVVGVITNHIFETMTLPEIEARASQDAQLLLSVIMEKSVPHTLENQIDLDRLFLYSAPLLTVIDRIFMSMVAQYCAQRGYSLEAISKVKHKTEFCAKFAEECHKRASSTAGYIEDLSARHHFIEQMATECNRRNLLRPSKGLANWGFLGKKDRSMTLSIDQDALKTGSKILEDVLTNIRNR